MLYNFFKRLFIKKRNIKLTKIEYWKRFELIELFDALFEVEKLFTELVLQHTDDEELQKFANLFVKELYYIEGDNVPDFTEIWKLFKPDGKWNSFPVLKENQLAKEIYRISDRWKRNQEFVAGAKVSLGDEFGVVLNTENEIYGLIRWDTNVDDDTEDWRYIFGSFQDMGGEVINPDFKFEFINDDGSKK